MPSFTRLIILQAAIVVSAVLYKVYSKYNDNTPCSKDSPISFTSTKQQREYIWTDTCQLFSLSYEEARGKFRQILQTYDNVETLSFPISMKNGHEPLTIDVAIFPGNTAEYGTIVHSSGLHGVEGYAGSAIQLALLQKDVLPLSSGTERPTIVFVHSLNPVGMKEYRRFNENNVDLNRNFIQGDFNEFIARRDPDIANYEKFRRFLSPTDPDLDKTSLIDPTSSWYSLIGIWWDLLPQLYRYGFVALKRAMVSGQYHHPNGIFYGGQELQPSVQRLQEFWYSRPDLFENAPSLVWIDVHTGLGPFGKDSLHCSATFPANGAKSSFFALTGAELHEYLFPTSHSITTSVEEGDAAEAFVGYDLTEGGLISFFPDIYTGSGIFMTQEFGTLPAILVGRGLILDNIFYQQHLTTEVHNEEIEQRERSSYKSPYLGHAFYPQSSSWRSSIVKRGVALMLQSIELSKS
jgi:hypothetical protein